jgi:hypothetical protein
LSIPSGNCETILPNRNPAVEVHQPESKPMSESRILILFAHPAYQRSRGNRFLVEAVQQSDAFTFRDLYEHYPDFNIDVAEEQRLHGMLDRPTDEEMRRIASQYTTVLRGVSHGSLPWRNLAEGAYLNSGEGFDA